MSYQQSSIPSTNLPLKPVKRWRRAAAGVDVTPDMLRTPALLFRSINYISSACVLDRTLDDISPEIRQVCRPRVSSVSCSLQAQPYA